MLTIYRRHIPECSFFGKKNQRSSRANQCEKKCPIWVQGSLRGEYVRRSLNLSSWQAPSEIIRDWEASGHVGVIRPEIPSVTLAVSKFLDDPLDRRAELVALPAPA